MLETTAAALPNREPFPTWRIVIWALGSVGSTIIGSLTGLMTYFYIPPQTAQSDFPQYLSSEAILGITLLGFIGYIGGILVVILNPYIANWSDRADRGKMFAYILLQPHPIGLGDGHAWFINDCSIAILRNKDRGGACFRIRPAPI